MSKELKKYLNTYGAGWMILSLIFAVPAVAILVSAISEGEPVILVPAAIMIGLMLLTMIPLFRSLKFFKRMETDPALPFIEADFKNAVPMRKGRVRFGETYVFAKRKRGFLQYGEIKQIYQYIHRTNFIEDQRELKYVDIFGNEHTLCKLALWGRSDNEVQAIISRILAKNPNVIIGYR